MSKAAILPPRPKRVYNPIAAGWHELTSPDPRREPFLDGLRTIAILLVVNGHGSKYIASLIGPTRWTSSPLAALGWTGVDLFFVLSGFFIGGQLWKELRGTGTVSFPRFIMRRGLRIWPLYFATLLAMIALYPAIASQRHYGWTDALFITNYLHDPEGLVNGSWSLCVEEQFYILTPLLLLLVGQRTSHAWRWILGSLLATEILFRALSFHALTSHFALHDPAAMQVFYFPLHTHSDSLIVGLIIALMAVDGSAATFRRLPWVSIAAGLLCYAAAIRLGFEYLNFTGLALFFGGVVLLSLQRRVPIFDGRLFYVLSRLSFGMYLNHECIQWAMIPRLTASLSAPLHSRLLTSIAMVIALMACSAAFSLLTFCLIEHPFLELRTRLFRRLSRHAAPAPAIIAH